MFVLLGVLVIGLVIVEEILMGLGLDVGLELRQGAKGRTDFAPTDIPPGLAFACFEGTHILVGVGFWIIFGDIHDVGDRCQLRIHRDALHSPLTCIKFKTLLQYQTRDHPEDIIYKDHNSNRGMFPMYRGLPLIQAIVSIRNPIQE